jgi:hypothetical protein
MDAEHEESQKLILASRAPPPLLKMSRAQRVGASYPSAWAPALMGVPTERGYPVHMGVDAREALWLAQGVALMDCRGRGWD